MNLNYIVGHVVIGARSIKVNWPYMVSNLAFPLSLLFVVGILSQGKLLPFALVGGLLSIIAMNGITAVSYLGSLKFDYIYQDLIMTTKTSKIDYMFAHLLGELVWIIPSVVLYFVLDIIFSILTPYTFLMTLFLGALVSVATYSISFWFSGVVKNNRYTPAIGTVLGLLMITLPPTFYPYTYLPKSALYILTFIPTTPAVILAQGVFGIAPMQWYMLPVLIIETLAYFLIAKYLTKWRED